ncbi:MAG: hypothetical protein AAF264_07265 [Pseudomonadota bacterium]
MSLVGRGARIGAVRPTLFRLDRPALLHLGLGPNLRTSPFYEPTLADGLRSASVYNHMVVPGHFGDSNGEYDRLIRGVAMWDVVAQRQVASEGPDAGRLGQVWPVEISTGRQWVMGATCRSAAMTGS